MSQFSTSHTNSALPDAAKDNWVDRFAPLWSRPYLRLIRADRPIGTYLLFFPCLWAFPPALLGNTSASLIITVLIVCAVGAFVTRSLGCLINDLADRKIDARVERTKNRPLASGQISVRAALIFFAMLASIALALLPLINKAAALTALGAVPLILSYPLMKRITHWPQVVLGLCMNWGFLVAWMALELAPVGAALLIFAGAAFWTIGYDTIYAFQDRDDDRLIGVGSTALLAEAKPKLFVGLFYGLTLGFMAFGWFMAFGSTSAALLVPAGIHLAWQIIQLRADDGQKCLTLFRANKYTALLFALPGLGIML